jgi:SM-20-related protein
VSTCADLERHEVSIRDRFLAPAQVAELRECAHARQARGEFAAARIGSRATVQRRSEIRGDFTCWLHEPLYPSERLLLGRLEQLRLEMNREAFLGLAETELHYAWYPPGAGYARHVDQPQGTAQRRVSLVLYLNVDWDASAGGVLRLYDTDDRFRDIEPIAGRLVCFLAPGREHSVLPTYRDRLSISGWFRAR